MAVGFDVCIVADRAATKCIVGDSPRQCFEIRTETIIAPLANCSQQSRAAGERGAATLQRTVDSKVLETLLPLLRLQDFLSVSQTCVDLRRFVHETPPSSWKSAATRTVPAGHPLVASSGCSLQAALRHFTIKRALQQGQVTSRYTTAAPA